jgi:hypothetical protein
MMSTALRSLVASAALMLLIAPVAAQPPAEKPPPRTADGKPDMSGIWVATGALLLFEGEEAFAAARAADAAAGRPPGNSNETPPYKPEAEAQRQYFLSRRGIDDPMAQCLLTGVPRINFRPLPFEIVQLPDRVIMLYEIHHAFRIIPADGREPPEDAEPSYLGESVGRWEGDTFVVDVTSFNTQTWLTGGSAGGSSANCGHASPIETQGAFDAAYRCTAGSGSSSVSMAPAGTMTLV